MTGWPIADPVWLKPAERALHAEMLAYQRKHNGKRMEAIYVGSANGRLVLRLINAGLIRTHGQSGERARYEALAVPWMDAVKLGYVRDGLVHWEYT